MKDIPEFHRSHNLDGPIAPKHFEDFRETSADDARLESKDSRSGPLTASAASCGGSDRLQELNSE